jgi:spermidine synthase
VVVRLIVALIANAGAFVLTVRLMPGLQFAVGEPRGRIIEAAVAFALLGLVGPWLVRRAIPERPRARRVAAIAVVAVVASAIGLVVFAYIGTALGIGFRVGHLPGSVTADSFGWVALGAAGLALGPVATELIEPLIARAPSVSQAIRLPSVPILLVFLLSGAAGLIYEVVWARQLVLVFGNTTQAVSAILTGYFGGLALGSLVGGRIADRVRRPLRMYGLLELLLVVVVLITPLLFRSLDDLYRPLFQSLSGSPTELQLVRYGLALLALAPATVLMGATLPTLARHLARRRSELGSSFGRLYAANTIGAIAGTLVAGLVLIELLGLTATLVVGAIGSATAGLSAILIDRRDTAPGVPPPVAPVVAPAVIAAAAPPSADRSIALAVAFVSGLTSLGYQLLWTRTLASGSGNTTYVFTLILATFLVGIAAGAAIITRRANRLGSVVGTLGLVQVGVSAIVLAGLVILSGQTPALPFIVRVIVVVLPATLVLGLTLPLASRLVGGADGSGSEGGLGRDAGLLLAANTIGAIGGTFVVPFFLIPVIGSLRALVLLAFINAGFGVWLLIRGRELPLPRRRFSAAIGVAVLAVALVSMGLPGDPLVMDPGATRLTKTSVLLASAEDEIAAVQAGGTSRSPTLLVGGTGMTKLSVDTKLMAYLPLMVRPTATRMLVIAFGMGSAYRAGLIAGLTVEGVELVPSVPSMMQWFYPDAASVLADPSGHITITDGRNYVQLSDQHYDLIVVDPPPPIASSGTSVLYSQEFYEASAGRLNDGGVMMEWIPYDQTVDEFRAHVQTFRSVFPNVLIAFGPRNGGVYMLGSRGSVSVDPANVAQVLTRPEILDDLMDTTDNPIANRADWAARIDSLTWISGGQVAAFAGSAPIITDDRPFTEYFILRYLFGAPSPRMNKPDLVAATPPG